VIRLRVRVRFRVRIRVRIRVRDMVRVRVRVREGLARSRERAVRHSGLRSLTGSPKSLLYKMFAYWEGFIK